MGFSTGIGVGVANWIFIKRLEHIEKKIIRENLLKINLNKFNLNKFNLNNMKKQIKKNNKIWKWSWEIWVY